MRTNKDNVNKGWAKYLPCICLLAVYFAGITSAFSASAPDEYELLRKKWKVNLIGETSYNPSDSLIAKRIAAIDSEAKTLWQQMEKTAGRKYLWADVVSTAIAPDIWKSYARLKTMALAYETQGTSLYRHKALKNDIINGMEWLYTNCYNPTIKRHEDYRWWYWQIGAPLQLNDILVLMYDDFTSEQVSKYMAAIGYYNPDFNHITKPGNIATGANRVWMFTVQALRGVLLKDSAKIAEARDGLSDVAGNGKNSVFKYTSTGDGFYPDGSFLQHEKFPYTGGYGNGMLNNIVSLLDLLSATRWQVKDPDHKNLYRWIYDSYEPFLYKGAMMDMVRGREVSRQVNSDHAVGHNIIGSILKLSRFAPDSIYYKRLVVYFIKTDTYRNFFSYASIPVIVEARKLMNNQSIAPRTELVLHKQFSSMDRVVHLRPGFGFGLSMSSSRIYNYESINDENIQGWYQAEGTTYLYNNDLAHFSEDYWATVNAQRLPGTTVDSRPREPVSLPGGKAYLSPNNWTGGTQYQNRYGVSGMDLKADSSSLTAHKSWFMFDDEIVCLGSGITHTENRSAETIVENRRLNASGNNALTINKKLASSTLGWSSSIKKAKWIHLNGSTENAGIGYFFPASPTIHALREARTGSWKEINKTYPDSIKRTRNYLTIWFTHPANSTDETYAYALLPNKTSEQVARYAKKPDFQIITNTFSVQAVKEKQLNITGFNFWTDVPTTADMLTCNKKASVMIQERPDSIEIAASDPTQANSGIIVLEIKRNASALIHADKGIKVVQLSPVIKLEIDVNEAKGRTFNASFSTASK